MIIIILILNVGLHKTRLERLLVNEMKLGLLAHAHSNIMRRVTIQIIDQLKRNSQPEAKHNHHQHDALEREIGLLGEEEIAHTEEHILRVVDHIVDQVSEACGASFQVEIDKNVNEGAHKVVELLENLLARIVDLLRRDAVVGLQAQYPEVHDEPMSENDHEKP